MNRTTGIMPERSFRVVQWVTCVPGPTQWVEVGPGAWHITCSGAGTCWEPEGSQEQQRGLETPQEITMAAAYGCAQCEKGYSPS